MPSYVVVGASRGIGYQFLKTLSADPGNTVLGVVRSIEPTQSQVSADKLPVTLVHGDLLKVATLFSAAEETSKITGGKVDYLILNAALLGPERYMIKPSEWVGKEEVFSKDLHDFMDTNVAGVMYAINAFLPLVRKSSIKKVIVLSSGHADHECIAKGEVSDAIGYSISKAAVNILVAKYAVELKGEGIFFLALSPGVVNTTPFPDVSKAPPEVQGMFQALTQQFRKYEPSFNGPISPEDSVRYMLKVIEEKGMQDSGGFVSHWGSKRFL